MLAQMNSMAAATARSQHTEIGLEHAAAGHVAEGPELNDLLGLRSGATVDDIIEVALLNPVKDVMSKSRQAYQRETGGSKLPASSRRQHPFAR